MEAHDSQTNKHSNRGKYIGDTKRVIKRIGKQYVHCVGRSLLPEVFEQTTDAR